MAAKQSDFARRAPAIRRLLQRSNRRLRGAAVNAAMTVVGRGAVIMGGPALLAGPASLGTPAR